MTTKTTKKTSAKKPAKTAAKKAVKAKTAKTPKEPKAPKPLDPNGKILAAMQSADGLTYKAGLKLAGWTVGRGRFTQIAKDAGFKFKGEKSGRETVMRAV